MPQQNVSCEACLRRLPSAASYRVGKPIIVTRVLNPDGHALYRHRSGGAISLCLAPPVSGPDRLTVGELRARRTALGLSQPDFAVLCSVSERQVIRWEGGHTPVPRWVPAVLERELAARDDAPMAGDAASLER